MSITRRSLLGGAIAVPAMAALPAPPAQAWGNKITITDPLDQYRIAGWRVMWQGRDPERFRELYRIASAHTDVRQGDTNGQAEG